MVFWGDKMGILTTHKMQMNMKYGELEEMILCGYETIARMIFVIAIDYQMLRLSFYTILYFVLYYNPSH